jgi:hypothetical protein
MGRATLAWISAEVTDSALRPLVRNLSPLRLSVDLPLSSGHVNGFNLVRR